MPAVVDARKGVVCALLYLAVHDGIRGHDVGEAGGAEAWGVDLLGYCLTTEPVAVICDEGELVIWIGQNSLGCADEKSKV